MLPIVTQFNELYLTLFVPTNSRTTQVFADIAAEVRAKAYHCATWPEKARVALW